MKKNLKNKKIKVEVKDLNDTEKVYPKKTLEPKKKDFWGRIGNFVQKAVDCCLE